MDKIGEGDPPNMTPNHQGRERIPGVNMQTHINT
jgi:hypothetical protein